MHYREKAMRRESSIYSNQKAGGLGSIPDVGTMREAHFRCPRRDNVGI